MTHRHPASVVPSVASLISSMRSFYSDHEDTLRTGREQLLIWADYFARFLRDRRELGREDQMVDVFFDDFVKNQMAVVDSIYARFGWELRPEDRARMKQLLQRERRGNARRSPVLAPPDRGHPTRARQQVRPLPGLSGGP